MEIDRGRRICGGVLCFLLSCLLMIFPITVYAAESQTVRVGLYSRENYHTVDENGVHSGYAYEYLMKIASYTGWKYEFVPGTLDECLDMLERGEIDILTGIQKTEDRLDKMAFSDAPTMYASACLLQSPNAEPRAYYEDFEAFDGMRIGVVQSASINEVLREYSREHQFSYVQRNYATGKDALRALDQGEIDAACLASDQNLEGYRILAHLGYIQYYYAVSLNRTDLLLDLNEAIQRINTSEQKFLGDVYTKYFNASQTTAFSKSEQAYIDRSEPVEAALYMGVGELFCRYNEEKQCYEGLAIDTMELLSERTGLTFSYTEIPEGQTPYDYLLTHPNTVVVPALLNNLITMTGTYTFLDPIIEGRMLCAVRQQDDFSTDEAFVLAVPEGLYPLADQLTRVFPNASVIACADHSAGLEMVRSKQADMALVNAVTAAYELQSPFYHDLKTLDTFGITEDMTLALNSQSEQELISILKKGVSTLTKRDVRQIVVNNTTANSYQMSWNEWMYANRYSLALAVCAGIGLIGIMMCLNRRKKIELRMEERYQAKLEYQEILLKQANYDDLTGLYTQKRFYEAANRLMNGKSQTNFAFFCINIEKFSVINEIYGEEAADAVLLGLADILRTEVGEKGCYGRLYSDQFAVCVPMDQKNSVRMPDSTVRVIQYRGQSIRVQMEVGVYINEDGAEDAQRSTDYAHLALRHGTFSGEAHFCYYQDQYLETVVRNQFITNNMESALQEGQFQVYFQPQYDIPSGKMVGAEALVRWNHPKFGMIPPNAFIPVLEGNGFIYHLDSYVCRQVCKRLAKWKEMEKLVPISINLSRVDLENSELVSMLRRTLEEFQIPARYLHLEITESAYVENQQQTMQAIEKLRKEGFLIEMDDFGSGYSSLNMLKNIPVDVLKLDMKFFDGETQMDRGGNIIESVVRMAHSMGMIVVAEGVETQREANFLKNINCSLVQGYLYSRPLPEEEFERKLAETPVGSKTFTFLEDEGVNNLYWKMEKFNLVMYDEQVMVLDYDPTLDYAILISMDQEGKRHELGLSRYMETMPDNLRIHPDDRWKMRMLLSREHQNSEELDFQADYDASGIYRWFHAVAHYYQSSDSQIRVITTIRPMEQE